MTRSGIRTQQDVLMCWTKTPHYRKLSLVCRLESFLACMSACVPSNRSSVFVCDSLKTSVSLGLSAPCLPKINPCSSFIFFFLKPSQRICQLTQLFFFFLPVARLIPLMVRLKCCPDFNWSSFSALFIWFFSAVLKKKKNLCAHWVFN